jgi:nitrogen fixation/metabolism regulation signal transduction histidine kinase
MKRLIHFPKNSSIGIILITYVVIMVLVLIWASQLLDTVTADDPGQAPVLLVLSIIFPAALLVIAGMTLGKAIGQKKKGAPGSRLRLRLIGSFGLIVIVTVFPVGMFSYNFLKSAVDIWLAPENGRALKSGEHLALTYYRDSLDRLESIAGSKYLSDLLESGTRDAGDIWRELIDVAPYVNALQVIGEDGGRTMGNPELFLGSEDLVEYSSEGPLPRRIIGGRTILSWQRLSGDRRVILSTLLPADFERETREISLAFDDWKRYGWMKDNLVAVLAVFGGFLSGPLVLLALLSGMVMSDRVIRPLVALGEATRKITEGDFSFRVISPRDDELDFLSESFNRMISELEVSRTKIVQTEKVAAWQVIAQRLAHELRNPLTPIKLSAQRVQKKAADGSLDDETLRKSVELILREVDGLDKLLQDFRDFAGGGPPQLTALSLREVLHETVERFRAEDSSIDWQLISGDEVLTVLGDPLQLRQVLVNLLKNAMEAGSTRVTVRGDLIYRGTVPYVRLMVRDDGEGIAADRAASVFQPYDSTRKRGSGLGLAVVQRIVYDHRGRIWFESQPGLGTVFYIDLPFGEKK